MKRTLLAAAILVMCLTSLLAQTKDTPVTLILHSGEEILCRVADIWKGEIYFEAASPAVTYRFGDRVTIDNVAKVKLPDGRFLSVAEFVDYREGRPSAGSSSQPQPPATPAAPVKVGAQAGMRFSSSALQSSIEKSDSRIGLRMPEAPQQAGQPVLLELNQLADMLAELGMAGRVLYETSQGALAARKLTDTQKRLVAAIKQSEMWQRRRGDLREAHKQAFAAFNAQYGKDTSFMRSQFDFEPQDGGTAFLEFVQYLHTTAAVNVESQWQKVDELLGERGAAALADILNNYDDWYFLYGSELESR
jgi:hypothetical protein